MSPIEYTDIRHEIDDGYLLSFGGTWFQSYGIRYWTNQEKGLKSWCSLAPISHVGYAIWQDYGKISRLCCLESVGGGPRMVPLSSLMRNYGKAGGKVYFQRPIHGHSREVVESALEMWGMGLHYPREEYLAIMFAPFRWLKGDDVDRDGVTCSEFVTAAAARAGLWEGKDPALVTPIEFSESGLFELPRQEIFWKGA